ncbi:MAG TPA: Holliday junction branch migration protein RuvA [Phycisphaerae bacterium]|nr:Holliday junction branch migration protein RuvA [Phycisphaerae bacterium]
MIVRLRGILTELTDETAIVERGDVAHEALVPAYAAAELRASLGSEITLHTLEYFEANMPGGNMTPRLVGFLRSEDRAFFKLFITVKGMGSRKGLRALAAPAAKVASEIERGDLPGLMKLPGIGRRMAEQIVAELRGKVTEHAVISGAVDSGQKLEFTDEQLVAVEIITQWGDTRSDAQRWLARAAQLHQKIDGPDEWVKAAYRVKSGAER